MIAHSKLALALSAALLSSTLILAGCFRETSASVADDEVSRAAGEAARTAALATGAAQSAVDDLVAANDSLLRRVTELESQLARGDRGAPRVERAAPAERVVEAPIRYEPDDAAPAPVAADPGCRTAAYEPGYTDRSVAADVSIDDDWRTRTVSRDLPRPSSREPVRDVVRRPEPAYRRVTVGAGTRIAIEILDPISTRSSQAGDTFRARLAGDLLAADGRVAIRDGAKIRGRVVEVRRSQRIGGRPALAIELDRIELPDGSSAPLAASWSVRGKNQTPKDAATIGGATVGGAILGRIFDKGEGEVVGGLVGAAAGTALARQRVGQPIVLDTGEVVSMTLRTPIEVRVRR